MATQVAVTKWLHTLFITSWCLGVSEGALKEAISFASVCSSQLFLTDGSDISSQTRSLHKSNRVSSNRLLMRSWTSDRLLPNTFSCLTCSNCCDNLFKSTSVIFSEKCNFHVYYEATTILLHWSSWVRENLAWMNFWIKCHSSAVCFQGQGTYAETPEITLSRR